MLSDSLKEKRRKIKELKLSQKEKNVNVFNTYYRIYKKANDIRPFSTEMLAGRERNKKDFQANLRAKNCAIYGDNCCLNSVGSNYNLINPYVTMLLASGMRLSHYDSTKYIIKEDKNNVKNNVKITEKEENESDFERENTKNNGEKIKKFFGLDAKAPLIDNGETNYKSFGSRTHKRIFSSLIGKTCRESNSPDQYKQKSHLNSADFNTKELIIHNKIHSNKQREKDKENKKMNEYFERYHTYLNINPDEFKKFKESANKTLTGDKNCLKNEISCLLRTNPDNFLCTIDDEIIANDAYLDRFRKADKRKLDKEELEEYYEKYGINDELTPEEHNQISAFLKAQNRVNLPNPSGASKFRHILTGDFSPVIFNEGPQDFEDPFDALRKMRVNFQLANTLSKVRENFQLAKFCEFYGRVLGRKILAGRMPRVKITSKKKRRNIDEFKSQLFEFFMTKARHKKTDMTFNEFKQIDADLHDPQQNINKLINERIKESSKSKRQVSDFTTFFNSSVSPKLHENTSPPNSRQNLSRDQILSHLSIEIFRIPFPSHPPSRTMAAMTVDQNESVVYVYGGIGGIKYGEIYACRMESGKLEWDLLFRNKKKKLVTDTSEPPQRFGSTIHFYNDKLYIIGGEFDDWDLSINDSILLIYNIFKNKWELVTDTDCPLQKKEKKSTENLREKDEENLGKKEENIGIREDRGMNDRENKGSKGMKGTKGSKSTKSIFKRNSKLMKFVGDNRLVIDAGKKEINQQSPKLKSIRLNPQVTAITSPKNQQKETNVVSVRKKTVDLSGDFDKDKINAEMPSEKQENLFFKLKPCLRRNHISVLIGHSLFLYGGLDQEKKYLNDCWVYDLKENYWSKVIYAGRAPPPLGHHCCCLVLESEQLSNENLSLYYIPPSTRKTLPLLKGEGVFFFGGMNENRTPTNLFFYMRIGAKPVYFDIPKTEGKPPSPRISATMNFSPFLNMIIIHGGRNDAVREEFLNDFVILDLETLNWIKPTFKSEAPAARAEHQSEILGDKLLIFGGSNKRQVLNFDFTLVNLNFYEIAASEIKESEYDFLDDRLTENK